MEVVDDFGGVEYHGPEAVILMQPPESLIQRQLVGFASVWNRIFHGVVSEQQKAHDLQIMTGLGALMTSVQIEDIAIPFDQRPIRKLEDFKLFPITGLVTNVHSLEPAQDWLKLPPDVESRYYNGTRYGRPYLDAHQAIGLVFGSRLIAISSAGVDDKDRLKIVQIQDVTSVRKGHGRQYYKTGLQQGMLWRDTLVSAWEKIGVNLGVKQAVIQSTANNTWRKKWNAHVECYDEVATRLGYTLESGKKPNWVKDL